MRVAMIMSNYPELSEKFLINQVEGLISIGIDLDVYAAHDFKPEGAAAATLKTETYVRYAHVPISLKARFFAGPFMALKTLAQGPTAFFGAYNSNRFGTAAKNLKLPYFAQAFKGSHYDVIHCHFGWNGLIGSYLLDQGFADKLVVSFHGADINSYPSRHGKDIYLSMYKNAKVITSNTNFTNDKVVANGCPREKTSIIPVGLPADEYSFISELDRKKQTVLTVGRLVEKKGHRFALEAIAKLASSYNDLEYIVAGDGPLQTELEAYAKELGIADRTHFLGACDYATVKKLYAEATVFTLPSVTAANGDREGQGLVLQEAQARGLPVVSTWHNGIPDGVKDGITGYLVQEKDSASLAEKLGELLGNVELRTRMGKAGREFVAATYDTKILTKKLLEIYSNG